jgi:glycosyltransferase involved in cell wall biosynthesis
MTKIALIGMIDLEQSNGAVIHVKEIWNGLKEAGIDVILFSCGKNFIFSDDHIQVPVINRRLFRQLSWNFLGIFLLIYLKYKEKIDLFYSRMDSGDMVGLICSKLTGTPLIVELNGIPTKDIELYRPKSKLVIQGSYLWETLIYQQARFIVGASGYIKYVVNHFRVRPEKCREIPLGVNTALFRPLDLQECQRKLSLPSECLYITWVGSVAPWQGLSTLIRSCPIVIDALPNVKYLIVGDGIDLSNQRKLAADLKIEKNLIFTGKVPYEDVPFYIGASICCVATFPGNRGDKGTISALKSISYLACGKSMITSDMDELAEDIIRYEMGKVFSLDDPEQLGKMIIDIVRAILSDEKYINPHALQYAVPSRDWKNVCMKIADLIKNV